MCGIFGAVTGTGLDETRLRDITGLLRHRGPDGEDYVSFPAGEGACLDLLHTRLSIIDLSDAAAQPMSFGNGALWITYNGEIFNYRELREELRALGHRFFTESDTEVILAAYSQWGTDCVRRFNGDWAFCVYDRDNARLFLSRDRLGVKPLYYHLKDGNFAFSSELRPLFRMPFLKAEWHTGMTGVFMMLGVSDFSGLTMFKGVRQVEPATNMTYDIRTMASSVQRYWDPPAAPGRERFDPVRERTYIRDIRELFEDAVRIRLRSDVPVGTCLSGGLDSSGVVSIIASLMNTSAGDACSVGPVQKTFTAAYTGESVDEERWARMAAGYSSCESHVVYPGPADLESDVMDLVETHGEPFISTSMYSQYRVMRLASEHVKVVLDGQGADELFGGYEAYREYGAPDLTRVKSSARSLARKLFPRLSREIRSAAVRFAFGGKGSLAAKLLDETIDMDMVVDVLEKKVQPTLGAALRADETGYNLQQLLRYEDRNSMRFGVEARVPFTDHRLVEYAMSISPSYKIKGGWSKYILRKALEDILPPDIVWRRDKIGFATPESKWLRGMGEFRDFLGDIGVRRYNGDHFWWRLFNLYKMDGVIR